MYSCLKHRASVPFLVFLFHAIFRQVHFGTVIVTQMEVFDTPCNVYTQYKDPSQGDFFKDI